jgi:hypothetical protein
MGIPSRVGCGQGNALLAIILFGADEPLSGWFEIYQRKPAKAIQ